MSKKISDLSIQELQNLAEAVNNRLTNIRKMSSEKSSYKKELVAELDLLAEQLGTDLNYLISYPQSSHRKKYLWVKDAFGIVPI